MALAFRDAIANALADDAGEIEPLAVVLRFPDANAILAMSEMQAIKKALFDVAYPPAHRSLDEHIENLRTYNLPESTIEWVLS